MDDEITIVKGHSIPDQYHMAIRRAILNATKECTKVLSILHEYDGSGFMTIVDNDIVITIEKKGQEMNEKMLLKTKFHEPQNCKKCIYLGSEEYEYYEAKKFDYYFCIGAEKTLIARYGEDGDYYSGTVFAFGKQDERIHPLRRAAMLAMCYPEIVDMMDKHLASYPEKHQDFIKLRDEIVK